MSAKGMQSRYYIDKGGRGGVGVGGWEGLSYTIKSWGGGGGSKRHVVRKGSGEVVERSWQFARRIKSVETRELTVWCGVSVNSLLQRLYVTQSIAIER